jgi:hypothetical protein
MTWSFTPTPSVQDWYAASQEFFPILQRAGSKVAIILDYPLREASVPETLVQYPASVHTHCSKTKFQLITRDPAVLVRLHVEAFIVLYIINFILFYFILFCFVLFCFVLFCFVMFLPSRIAGMAATHHPNCGALRHLPSRWYQPGVWHNVLPLHCRQHFGVLGPFAFNARIHRHVVPCRAHPIQGPQFFSRFLLIDSLIARANFAEKRN